jgi:hypothetical protein
VALMEVAVLSTGLIEQMRWGVVSLGHGFQDTGGNCFHHCNVWTGMSNYGVGSGLVDRGVLRAGLVDSSQPGAVLDISSLGIDLAVGGVLGRPGVVPLGPKFGGSWLVARAEVVHHVALWSVPRVAESDRGHHLLPLLDVFLFLLFASPPARHCYVGRGAGFLQVAGVLWPEGGADTSTRHGDCVFSDNFEEDDLRLGEKVLCVGERRECLGGHVSSCHDSISAGEGVGTGTGLLRCVRRGGGHLGRARIYLCVLSTDFCLLCCSMCMASILSAFNRLVLFSCTHNEGILTRLVF